MPVITGRSPHIHWEERGTGSPLLLVMGHRFSGRMWAPIIDGLAAEHRVLWFDNRGTGQSGSTSDATIADLGDDGFAVLDAAGIESAHVMGASQGGVVVLDMAMRQPARVRSLVVGCSGALTADKPRSKKTMDWVVHAIPQGIAIRFMAKGFGPACPPDRADAAIELMRGEVSDRRGVLAQSKALRGYATTLEDVARIQVPTLVVHGTADTAVKHAWGVELDETLPDSRMVSYEGVGHNFVCEMPDRTAADVNGFLASVDAA
jgi:3-oxoadipate enol-lactonase